MNSEMLGIWELDPQDIKSLEIYGKISVEFKISGEMIYSIYSGQSVQKIFLIYYIKDDLIITDQSSVPSKQETRFRLLSNGKLNLNFNQIESTFIKIE